MGERYPLQMRDQGQLWPGQTPGWGGGSLTAPQNNAHPLTSRCFLPSQGQTQLRKQAHLLPTAGPVPYHHHTMRGQAAAPWGCLTKSPHMLYGLGLKGTPQSSAFSFLPDPYFLFQWEEHVRQTPPQGLCPLGVAL